MSSKQSNLRAILSVFNTRLFIILMETIVVFYLYDLYRINIKVDYTIMSIAIIFPLVFSITSAYQRRQDAITLYLEFRNKIIDLTNIFYAVESVKVKNYNELFNSLQEVQELLIQYLTQDESEKTFDAIREKRKKVLLIIDNHKKLFNERFE
jgi:hypothetical protein